MSDLSEENSDSEVENSKIEEKKENFIVNNVPALKAKLSAIQLNLDWVEKLDIAVNVEEQDMADGEDDSPDSKAENDFKREMSFYNQALHAVTKAVKRLKKLGVPTKRPDDYFAEMAKSDSHMNKVREKLLTKQTAVERREKIRSIRQSKKQGKKLQQQILSEKKSEKKKMLNALKKTKKGKMDADTLLNTKKDTPKFNNSKQKREYRDMKYGYGGKKRNSKRNTAESTDSVGRKSGGMSNRYFSDKKFGRPRPKKQRRRR